MTIDFYIGFTKRKNSTKRPTEGGIVVKHTLTGYLKEPCSILNPVINIQTIPVQNTPDVFTYAHINQFDRYYFVKDWTWNDGLWTVSLEVDVLATYRPHIGEKTAYIERCASAYNTWVQDKLYPTTLEPFVTDVFINAPWSNYLITDGCYVVGIISGSPSSTTGSAVTYYAMTFQQLTSLVQYLLSDQFVDQMGFPTLANTEPISHNIAKSFINPIQYIVSCIWIPKQANQIGESSPRAIQVGYYAINTTIATGYWMPSTVTMFECSCDLPTHPDASTRGEFLNYAPYTKMSCFLPPFGQFPIDLQYFGESGYKLHFRAVVDLITGKGTLRVSKENPTNLQMWNFYETSAMFGVPIQLAQVANDLIKATTSVISTATSAISAVGGFASPSPLGFIQGTTSGLMSLQSIGNAIESSFPQVVSDGANGSFVAFSQSAYLTAMFHKQVDEDNAEQGRPLCELRRIDTLSGYIKCGEATVDFYAFSQELDLIHSLLLSGFFWE